MFEHIFLYLSSFGVYRFQVVEIFQLFLSGIEEGIQAIVRGFDSAACVDSWSDDISYVIGVDMSFDIQIFQKSFQRFREMFACIHELQSFFYDNPIFTYERNDISDGPYSHDWQEIIEDIISLFSIKF